MSDEKKQETTENPPEKPKPEREFVEIIGYFERSPVTGNVFFAKSYDGTKNVPRDKRAYRVLVPVPLDFERSDHIEDVVSGEPEIAEEAMERR